MDIMLHLRSEEIKKYSSISSARSFVRGVFSRSSLMMCSKLVQGF
jgi:hypothetical protein